MAAATHLVETPARRAVIDADVVTILSADLPWSEVDGKTVLISGANGFLAAYLVEALLGMRARLGFGPARVLGLVRSRDRGLQRFSHHSARDDLQLIEVDVAQSLTLDGPVNYVIHAASPASPKFYSTDPVGVIAANVDGTRSLLELARTKEARFLLFSSGEVYGQASVIPTSETDYGYSDPAAVRSCYGESKRMAETMAVSWGHQYGLHTSIVRPFHTYGPGVALDDGRVFADFVADIVAGRDIVLTSKGEACRAFCYIADATAGFLTVLLKGAAGAAYNVGNPAGEISIFDLAQCLVGLFPERGLSVTVDLKRALGDYVPSPVSRNAPAIGRIEALGWRPQTDIPAGFRRMIASYL